MKKRELHYLYGVSYLVIIIVALIAFALFDVKSLVDKVSFALTITSLVLAVLAIIYTYLAGARQENQLSRLISTNHDITAASLEIKTAAAGLMGHVSAIPKGLQDINERLMTLSVQDLQKVAAEPALDTQSSSNAAVQPQAESLPIFDEQIHKRQEDNSRLGTFVSMVPFVGMGIMYAFLLAYNSDKQIRSEWIDENFKGNYGLLLGILYGARGAGHINFKVKDGVITPTNCSEIFVENLKIHLDRVVSVVNDRAKADLIATFHLAESTYGLQDSAAS